MFILFRTRVLDQAAQTAPSGEIGKIDPRPVVLCSLGTLVRTGDQLVPSGSVGLDKSALKILRGRQ